MQSVVIDKPYKFIPPRQSRIWHWVMRRILPHYLRKNHGISTVECFGAEKLQASLRARHGIMIVGNHCRPCDPMILDSLAAEAQRPFRVIASWHVFMANRFQRFVLPRMGGFSVYREGMDRESLKCAINTVAGARFPLVIFAEGIITRCNDRMVNFMDGPAFIARAAAKQRKEGAIVTHPVFIRYFFEGNLEQSVIPVIESIERRFSWQPQVRLPLCDRIRNVGSALLTLKELEYFQSPQPGNFRDRLARLIDRLLTPMEDRWAAGRHDGDTMARVKRLRAAILPEMVNGQLSEGDRAFRWRQLADVYVVQQLHCYPGDYLDDPTPERILETVERYDEDLNDIARPHFPIRATVTVGDAIEVSSESGRRADGASLGVEIRQRMDQLMESTKGHRKIIPAGMEGLFTAR